MKRITLYKGASYLYTIILYGASLRPLPDQIANLFSYQDKVMHFIAYTILAILYSLTVKNHLKVLLCALVIGTSIEILQYFTPYRSFELLDIIADLFGSLLGILLYRKLFDE